MSMPGQPKAVNGFGIASFVFGLIALLICWVPLLNFFVFPLAAIGVVLGIVGVITAIAGKQTGTSWPFTGLALNGSAAVLAVLLYFVAYGGLQAMARKTATPEPAKAEAPALTPESPTAELSPARQQEEREATEKAEAERKEKAEQEEERKAMERFELGSAMEKSDPAAARRHYRDILREYPESVAAAVATDRLRAMARP